MTADADLGGGPRRAAKAWSGRLAADSNPTLEGYTSSLEWDRQLAGQDIQGSLAHATALHRAGLIDDATKEALLRGLAQVAAELNDDSFDYLASDEDIHMAVERRLTELVGEPGARLHTGRSRNDQVALDLRLWTRTACLRLAEGVIDLQEVLLSRARQERRTLLPGYTHLQRAQPVTLGHHLLAYLEMLSRDADRLSDCHRRADSSPLGAGALAGTTLGIDRRGPAEELGFSEVSGNSMDAVSDRDFAAELTFCCALLAVHLSRLAEDLIIWNTREFSFVTLPDSWATGSSLMPQKKNPDILELVRGRASVPLASLVGLLALLKGLPLSYNRDLQEDKRHLFSAVEVTQASMAALVGLLAEIQFSRRRMASAASDPELLATDLAEQLVAAGVPFRQAHEKVGAAVRRAEELNLRLDRLVREQWREIGLPIDPEESGLFDPRRSLARREQPGAPGPRATASALRRAATLIRRRRGWIAGESKGLPPTPSSLR
ncbi:MAG: argininosuccinate lyase [Candidatus Dormibacteria bacterium]